MTSAPYPLPNAFAPLRAAHLGGKRAAGVKDVLAAGELVLTSGRLVACDPLIQPERSPFTRALVPGSYPVYLFVARAGGAIGFAEVRLGTAAVARFWMATLPGQDPATLGPRETFCYPVDTGLGCFADEVALIRLREADAARRQHSDDPGYYDAVVRPGLEANGGTWLNHRPEPGAADNVVFFRSGDGDGSYPTWFGLDADDRVTCVVTSFRCFPEPETAEDRQARLAQAFAPLIAAVERDIGEGLRARGFVGPEATYKLKDRELKLVYTRDDGLSFEVLSSTHANHHLFTTQFRWARGRTTLDVGNEHRKAGIKLDLKEGIAVGDAAFLHAARLGASYVAHWDPLEQAVLGYLPVKRKK
ncbi:DUF4241 domain-containing protein [Nannocystis sp. ILAH1]|uniref:DUF4241 domain-containing protein n=1 Tax=Nannocystis sp. ILAH1 TaxID=2996789 RepID=UPI00227184F8|nr:DUF4241 domain-containing protein [Nannocystis sp. ILAH1]MCY0994718.1 DUF4241 domain-containing protein [Nannocystis sp. ILAH1]